jgi:hypothetical protein
MQPKSYKVLEMCIENGVKFGLSRAYKDTDNPTLTELEDYILATIEYEICEWFDMGSEND